MKVVGGLALACFVAGAFCTYLMYVARGKATKSMDRICGSITSASPWTSVEGLFTPDALSSLKKILPTVRPLTGCRYKILTCQISGEPCIATLDLSSGRSIKSLNLYFYDGHCAGVVPAER